MSSIGFVGGPLDGQTGEDPSAAADEGLDEAALLDRILSDARTALELGGLSEKSKLLIEKATTLFQQIKAEEEREQESAMSGKLSPRLMQQAYGAGG